MEFIQNLGMPQRLLAAALVIGVLALLLFRQRSAQTASSAGREKTATKQRTPRSRGRGAKASSRPAKSKEKRAKGKKESAKPSSGGRGRRRSRDESNDVEDMPTPTAAVGRMVPRLPAAGEASDEDPFAGAIGSAETMDGDASAIAANDGLVAEPGWPSNEGWSNGDLAQSDQSTQVMQPLDAGSSLDATAADQAPQTDWSDDADDFDPATGWGAPDDDEAPVAAEPAESEWTEETADWTVEAGWETVDPAAEAPVEVADEEDDWAVAETSADTVVEPTWTDDTSVDAADDDWHGEDEADLSGAWQPVDEDAGDQSEQSFSDWGSNDESDDAAAEESGWGQSTDEVESIQDFTWDPSEQADEVHAAIAPVPVEVSGIEADVPVLPTGAFEQADSSADAAERWGASVGDVAHDAIDAEPVFTTSADGLDMTAEAYETVETVSDVPGEQVYAPVTADLTMAPEAYVGIEAPTDALSEPHTLDGTYGVDTSQSDHAPEFVQTTVDDQAAHTIDTMALPGAELHPTQTPSMAVQDQAQISEQSVTEFQPAGAAQPAPVVQPEAPVAEPQPQSTAEPMVVIEPAVIAAPQAPQVIEYEPVPAHEPMIVIAPQEAEIDRLVAPATSGDDLSEQRPAFNPVAALVGDQNAPAVTADTVFNDPSLVKSAPVPNPLNRWSELAPASITTPQDSTLLRSWERLQPSAPQPAAVSATMPIAEPAPSTVTTAPGAWWDQPLQSQAPAQEEQRGRFALGGFALAPGHHVVSGITFRESVVPPPTSWRLGPVDGPVAPGTLVLNVDGCLNCRAEDLEVLVEPGFLPTQDGFSLRLSALQNGPFAASGTFVIYS